jgi:hypothetical protein
MMVCINGLATMVTILLSIFCHEKTRAVVGQENGRSFPLYFWLPLRIPTVCIIRKVLLRVIDDYDDDGDDDKHVALCNFASCHVHTYIQYSVHTTRFW